jgi:nucleotide-binding universal stress UspA family protein
MARSVWRTACNLIEAERSPLANAIVLEAAAVTIKSIVCGVDFSPASPGVLRAAMALAERERVPLTVLHVLDPLLVQAARIEYEEGLIEASVDRDLKALIAQAAEGLSIDPRAVRRLLRVGAPDGEILAQAAENPPTLVVMGTHGLSGVRRLFFGSTAARVIARATMPVLALPPHAVTPATAEAGVTATGVDAATAGAAPLALHRILVAVDFTTECMKAIKEAAALAARLNLPLTLLHAVPTASGLERWKTFLELDRDKRITRARQELEMLANEIAHERLAVRVIAAGGTIEEVINRIAGEEPGTLVVMGLRAPSLLPPGSGATAYRLLSITSSPVLIVPDADPRGRRLATFTARDTARV